MVIPDKPPGYIPGHQPANSASSNGTITYPTTSQPITSTLTGTTGYIDSSEEISPINSIVCELKHQRQIRPNYGAKKWPTFWEENEPNFKKWKFLEITAFFGMCNCVSSFWLPCKVFISVIK